MTEKFKEGQQIWVCANLGGQLVREKGIVLSVGESGVVAGSFATPFKKMSEYLLDADGRDGEIWLEPRM